jgi:hypothetical protein
MSLISAASVLKDSGFKLIAKPGSGAGSRSGLKPNADPILKRYLYRTHWTNVADLKLFDSDPACGHFRIPMEA